MRTQVRRNDSSLSFAIKDTSFVIYCGINKVYMIIVTFLQPQVLGCAFDIMFFIPPANFVCGGYTVFTLSVCACVHPSVRNVLFP